MQLSGFSVWILMRLHRTKHMAGRLAALNCTKILIDHHEQPETELLSIMGSAWFLRVPLLKWSMILL